MTVSHTHSSGTSYLFLGARVGPAVEEGTDTDRKVGTQREERQRDREKRDRETERQRDRETERQRE